jgi:ribosomal protein S18 acetylase RimI-like enzyme
LGSRLLNAAVRFAEERGYEKLVLGTMSQMPAAQHLYERSGFVYKQEVTFWQRPMMIYEKGLSRN